MSVTFEDYYQTLGLQRDASAEDIKRAYRKLARTHHPDVSKDDPDASKKFAKVSEAYEVLSDPAKRKKFDQFGQHWKHGQSMDPNDFQGFGGSGAGGFGGFGTHGNNAGPHGFRFEQSDGNASNFFDALFGQMRDAHATDAPRFNRHHTQPAAPETLHDITVTLHEAMHGGSRSLNLQTPTGNTTLDIKIPAGVRTGSKIRLKKHGVLLRLKLAPHPDFRVQGNHLHTTVRIDPATAALGGKADVPTPDGDATLTIPPGTNSGSKLRLRGKGLPPKKVGDDHGDLLAQVMIDVPEELTDDQRAAYESLRDAK